MDIMTALAAIPGATHFLPYVASAVALCAAIAVALPRPGAAATGVYPVFYAVVNFVALNFGRARNADWAADEKSPTSSAPSQPPGGH